ncbi:Hypothetical protein, putative [Bodo saltans]|uniref:Uncharacterized protein n=1 Tax=Bodo saltans TaxID=75058 RepID=A0A0S4JJ31_BODSA|nr:Hypothetical protein, putative [Bodo saltans]|eukprot:CUG91474.1 Hypothetical protein, putative [Bodo saltans]
MGNVPPSGFTLPTQLGRVTVSTRSEPIGSFAVQREVGLVFGNSRAYNNQEKSHGQQAHLTEAIQMMVAEAESWGQRGPLRSRGIQRLRPKLGYLPSLRHCHLRWPALKKRRPLCIIGASPAFLRIILLR